MKRIDRTKGPSEPQPGYTPEGNALSKKARSVTKTALLPISQSNLLRSRSIKIGKDHTWTQGGKSLPNSIIDKI